MAYTTTVVTGATAATSSATAAAVGHSTAVPTVPATKPAEGRGRSHLILSHAALKLKVADAAAEVAHLALVGAVALRVNS